MIHSLENAKQILSQGGYTCVLCKGEKIFTSNERGVKPLVLWRKSENSFLGFSAADKVVGKGAAFIYVLLGVSAVYANVISLPALEVLQAHGIYVEYREAVSHIINRRGDGFCPVETAVSSVAIDKPEDAYKNIVNIV